MECSSRLEKGLGISGVASALPLTLGIIMLGLSAALFGTRVDSNGPRWAMVVSSCSVSGFLISALGLYLRQYWLVVGYGYGYGFVGGIGLGIGYISPVSTLIKWFRPVPASPPASRSWVSVAVR